MTAIACELDDKLKSPANAAADLLERFVPAASNLDHAPNETSATPTP